MSFENEIKQKAIFIEGEIRSHIEDYLRSDMGDIIEYVLFDGKFVRPILSLIVSEIFRCKPNIYNIIAVELIHAYSLIHDDLPSIDNDDFRRGKPSCHKKFSESSAILTGDGLLSLAFEMIARGGSLNFLQKASECIGFKGMILGQFRDINQKKGNVKDILDIFEKKTGMLFGLAAIAGVIDKLDQQDLIFCFGKNLGIAFQIADDIEDEDLLLSFISKIEANEILSNFIVKAYDFLFDMNVDKKLIKSLKSFINKYIGSSPYDSILEDVF